MRFVRIRFLLLPLILLVTHSVQSQEVYTSIYTEQPELLIDYVKDCADFWEMVEDTVNGGCYMDIARNGDVFNQNIKGMVSLSRNAYGFTKAFMLSGEERYLDLARSSLNFMYDFMWDSTYGGWFD